MLSVTIKQLLEAGVHFGHQTQRWNPKMKKYIFGDRNGIYIINLEITLTCLEKAMAFLKKTASEGKEILLVGTKRQAQEPLKLGAQLCGMPYVDQRWLGGMLTNFETLRKSIARLDLIDQMEGDGSFQFITKKEVLVLKKEREKLVKNLSGIRNMRRLPSVVFVIDSGKEAIAIKEAIKLGIPVVAVLDTNCNPDLVDYPIPGNDDAIRAVKLFCDITAQSIKEGRDQFLSNAAAAEAQAAQELAGVGADATTYTFAEAVVGEDRIEEKLAARFAEPPVVTVDKAKPKKPVRKESGRGKK